MNRLFFTLLPCLLIFSGCSLTSKEPSPLPTNKQSFFERNQQMAALTQWKINGKIAFIDGKKRKSADLYWQKESVKQQKLNLTTYLGINVLNLVSEDGMHTIEADGEIYQGDNLDTLIYQITQLRLPTKALTYWLKGIAYLPEDKILTNIKNNALPSQLTSYYNLQQWKITYSDYQQYQNHWLATKFTISQGNLKIKININQWQL